MLDGIDDQTDFAGIVEDFKHRPSVTYIKNCLPGLSFSFSKVTAIEVFKILKSLTRNKAMGCDNIPRKWLTIGASFLCEPLQYFVIMSTETSVFPDSLKAAEVPPAYGGPPYCLVHENTENM